MTGSLPLKRIDQSLFDHLADAARQRPRQRINHNLHQSNDQVQRFLNVLQPGTYVRPHQHVRHGTGNGFECFLVLQGEIGLLLFDDQGNMIQRERLSTTGSLRGIEVAANQVHSLVALQANTVIFELKQGPYQPCLDKDFLAGFPEEGSPAAVLQEQQWRQLFQDDLEP